MDTNGKSFKTTVAGILTFIGGLGALVAQFGLQDTTIGKYVTGVSMAIVILAQTFGFMNAKDSNVTGAGAKAETVK